MMAEMTTTNLELEIDLTMLTFADTRAGVFDQVLARWECE